MEAVVDGIIYQRQSHGGISRLYNEILPRMCAMDDSLQVTLLTPSWCKQSLPTHAHIQHRPIFPVEIILRPYRLWWSAIPHIRAFVQRLALGDARGRIWHSTYYTTLEDWTGPAVVTVYDMIYERFAHLFNRPKDEQVRQQKRRCVLAADAVICISETTQRDVQQFYGIDASKTQVVLPAYNPAFRVLENNMGYSLKPPLDKPFLLHVGSYRSYYKNFRVLLQAYSSWPRRKEVDLVVVGRQWSKEEVQHLAKLGIIDRVHLLMNVDDQRLCLLYNQASALVYPSLYEGFGIPLLEAMACGCPIIASRIPSTLELAGECPIYFEPTEVEALSAAFDTAFSEGRDSDRVRLGLERVEHYSWNKTAKQVLEVYRALHRSDRLPHLPSGKAGLP
jgi:glycosyltransferase involved in cell wall biosynthesis